MVRVLRLLRYDLPMHIVLTITNVLPDNVCFLRFRGFLCGFFLGSSGKKVGVGRGVTFYNPKNISLGNDVYIAKGCWFSAGEKILIGDEVLIGPGVVVASSNHTRVSQSFRFGPMENKSIQICKGSWIGANTVITAGSKIQSGVLIGANSVVVGEINADSFYAGNPARFKRNLNE